MSVSECEDVVCHMIPYLTVTCVKAICVSSLCSMAEQDPDLMWLLMVQLLPSELPHYPSNKLTPVKVSKLKNCGFVFTYFPLVAIVFY